MRFSRLLALIGIVVTAGGLHLWSIDTDAELVASLAGTPVPRIWDTADPWQQAVFVALVVGIVALVFRPRRGRGLRRLAGAGIGLLTAPAGLYVAFAYRDARAGAEGLAGSLDLAVLSGLISDSPGATAGWGHLVVLGGLVMIAFAGALELLSPGEVEPRESKPEPEAEVEAELEPVFEPEPVSEPEPEPVSEPEPVPEPVPGFGIHYYEFLSRHSVHREMSGFDENSSCGVGHF